MCWLGRNKVGVLVDVPTDPFMMLIVSLKHFDNESGFATANFYNAGGSTEVRRTVSAITTESHFHNSSKQRRIVAGPL